MQNSKTKILRKIVVVVTIIGLLAGVMLIREYRAQNMDAYAAANNCKWHYDYYFNKEPICK